MAKLTINEAVAGYTHKIAFTYQDLQRTGYLTTIGASNEKQVGSQGPGDIIDTAVLYLVTAAAGASDLVFDFGTTSATPNEYIAAADADAMTKVIWNTGASFTGTDSGSATTANVINGVANNTTSAKPLYMRMQGTLASLTAGSWVLAWRQLVPPTQ